MQDRLLLRGQTSGRSDDNIEAIQKRLKIYHEVSKPIIDSFSTSGLVRYMNSEADKEKVYSKVRLLFKPTGIKYSLDDGKKTRKLNEGYENNDCDQDNDIESDPTLFKLYEAEDGFRGSYDEVVAHEAELERSKQKVSPALV